MKLRVDQQADALYCPSGASSHHSEEVSSGVILDYDEQGQVVGIEVLCLSKRVPESEARRLLFESVA